MFLRWAFITFATLSSPLLGCNAPSGLSAADASPAEIVRIPVTITSETGPLIFQAEIADTPEERARGLMFRKSLGDKEGMLFLFPVEQQLSFWMRNTLIPLDMIFIQKDQTILGIVENAAPQTDTSRFIPGISQFVLELSGGSAAKLKLKAGQKVSFYAPIPTN